MINDTLKQMEEEINKIVRRQYNYLFDISKNGQSVWVEKPYMESLLDLISEINKYSIIKVLKQLVEREEGAKGNSAKKLQHEKGYNSAKQDTIQYLKEQINELK